MANIPDNADAQRTRMRARVVCAWWFTKGANSAKVAQATGCGIATANLWKPKDFADAATLPVIERKHRGIESVWRILENPTVTDVAAVCGISEATARKFLPTDVTMVRRHRTLADMPREQSRTFAAVEDMRAGVVMTAAELAKKHGLPGPVIYQIRDRWAPDWVPVNSRRKAGAEDDETPEAKSETPATPEKEVESAGKTAPTKAEKPKLDVAELANQVAATQAAKAEAAVARARAIAAAKLSPESKSATSGPAAPDQAKPANALAAVLAARYEARNREREQEREANRRQEEERQNIRGHGVRPDQRQDPRHDPRQDQRRTQWNDQWQEQGQGEWLEHGHDPWEQSRQDQQDQYEYEEEYEDDTPSPFVPEPPRQPMWPAPIQTPMHTHGYAAPQPAPQKPKPELVEQTPAPAQPVVDAYQILHDAIAEAWNTIEYPTPYKVAQAVGCTPYIAIKWKPKSKKSKPRDAATAVAVDGPRPGSKSAEIVDALKSGVVATIRELAEQFGVDRSQVYQISKKWVPEWTPRERDRKSESGESGGPATREGPREGSKTAQIVEVMKSGVAISVRELAEQFGVERSQIYQIIKRWAPEWTPKDRDRKSEAGEAGESVSREGPRAGSKTAGIVEVMNSGVPISVRELAEQFGVERSQIYQIAKRWAPEWSPKERAPKNDEGEPVAPATRDAPREGSRTAEIAAVMTSGVPISVRELAEQFGVERSQIYQIAKRWAPDWSPKERVSKMALKAEAKAAAKAERAAKKAEKEAAKAAKAAKRAAKQVIKSAAKSKPGRPMLVKTTRKVAGKVAGTGKVASAESASDLFKDRAKVTKPLGARAADAPRAGSVTEAIVADWNSGVVTTASEAAAKHGVSVTTATTALHRWTDYAGRSGSPKKRK